MSSDDLREEFVDDIAERSKVRGVSGVVFLGNECEEGGFEGLKDLSWSSRVLDYFPYIYSDDAPAVVEEIWSEPIRPWRFSYRGIPEGLIHLFLNYWYH